VGQVMGKTGKVVGVFSDGDLKVDFGGRTWTLNPQCCIPVSQGQLRRLPSTRASIHVNAESSSDDSDNDNSQYYPLDLC